VEKMDETDSNVEHPVAKVQETAAVYIPSKARLSQTHQRIVIALQRARSLKLKVPNDPPSFQSVSDVYTFKKKCLNLETKELGTLCYLNDLMDTELFRLEYSIP
jgi:hypothetical protein